MPAISVSIKDVKLYQWVQEEAARKKLKVSKFVSDALERMRDDKMINLENWKEVEEKALKLKEEHQKGLETAHELVLHAIELKTEEEARVMKAQEEAEKILSAKVKLESELNTVSEDLLATKASEWVLALTPEKRADFQKWVRKYNQKIIPAYKEALIRGFPEKNLESSE